MFYADVPNFHNRGGMKYIHVSKFKDNSQN